MNIRIKGRNWWGKRPKNSWSAKNRMYSILRNKDNGVYEMSNERLTCEEWYNKLQLEDINWDDIKRILWDWQNDRTELIHLLQDLEWADETIDGVRSCPSCGRERPDGHVTGCKLEKAIK